MAKIIIPDSIRDVLGYDPVSGNLYWLIDSGAKIRKGRIAGNPTGSGYLRVQYKGVSYMAHRLCYFLAHGEQPEMVDHYPNRDGTDNRQCNLRAADNSLNQMNKDAKRVFWKYIRSRGKWYACSTYRAKNLYVGTNITTAWFRRIMAERADHPIGLPKTF